MTILRPFPREALIQIADRMVGWSAHELPAFERYPPRK